MHVARFRHVLAGTGRAGPPAPPYGADPRETGDRTAQERRNPGRHVALRGHGAEYRIADSAAPVRKAQGQMVGVVLVFSDASDSYRGAASWRATRRVFAPARRCRPTGAGCKTNNFASRTSKGGPMTGWRRRPRCTWARHPAGLRAFSKSFRGSHWNAIGMSGSSGCAALARAHASRRGAKTPGSSARCHSNPAVKCLAGLSTAHRALHPSRQSTCATSKNFEQTLTLLPQDQLKIDQSFVRNIGIQRTDALIAPTIIGMASGRFWSATAARCGRAPCSGARCPSRRWGSGCTVGWAGRCRRSPG